MKKFFAIFLLFVLFFRMAEGQTSLTVAKDFKAVDSRGVVQSLFHFLDNDKIVMLMFSSIGCGSCYASYPFVQTNHEEFGCNFGNVVTIIVSPNHNYTDFLGQPFDDFGSPMIPNPPGSEIVTDYSVFAFPTFIIIKPDRTVVEQNIWPISEAILRNKLIEHGGVFMDCPDVDTSEIAVGVNPAGSGTIRGAGQHIPGNQVEIEAIPKQGWTFENWTDSNSQIISTSPFHNLLVPDEDVSFTANFKMITSANDMNISSNQITLFPNPSRDFVSITVNGLPTAGQSLKFQVFDTMGRVLIEGNLEGHNEQIEISSLERGVYFIRVENSLQAAKFVKE